MSNSKHNKLFNMNLQLFGSSTLFPPGQAPDPSTNPLLQGYVEPAPAEPDPFILRDTQPAAPAAADPAILHGDPTPAAADPVPASSPTPAPAPAAEPLDVKALVSSIVEAMAAQNPAPASAAPAAAPPAEPTPEEIEEANTKMREAMLDNPIQFLKDRDAQVRDETKAAIMQEMQPLLDQFNNQQKAMTYNSMIDEFRANTPDYDQHVGAMSQFLAENPDLEEHPKALEIAYLAAKGKAAADPNTTGAAALEDPTVQEAAVKAYLERLKNGQPPVIVSGTGNIGSPTSVEKPKDIKEASRLFRQSMQAKGF